MHRVKPLELTGGAAASKLESRISGPMPITTRNHFSSVSAILAGGRGGQLTSACYKYTIVSFFSGPRGWPLVGNMLELTADIRDKKAEDELFFNRHHLNWGPIYKLDLSKCLPLQRYIHKRSRLHTDDQPCGSAMVHVHKQICAFVSRSLSVGQKWVSVAVPEAVALIQRAEGPYPSHFGPMLDGHLEWIYKHNDLPTPIFMR